MRWAALLIILGIFLTSALVPPSWVESIPLCLFHHLTGWDCPGCGLTRACIAFFHGHFRQAIQYNALVIPILLLFAIYAAGQAMREFTGRSQTWFTPQGGRWVGGLFLLLVFGQWIYKTGLRAWGMF